MKISPMKAARQKLKLSLERLSEDVGISTSQLSRFETGSRVPRVPEMERIAKRLGVTVDELRGVEAKAEPKPNPIQGLSEQQAYVVRLVVQAFLGLVMADPELRDRMQTQEYQAAVARIVSQYLRAQRLHEAIARDDEAALAAIQTALEFQLGELH
jgi:transcriptional regulator with XRE-family HTH domain